MSEKILVNENSIQVNSNRSQALDAAKVINDRLTPALAEIGLTISDPVLKDCLQGASSTQKSYFEAVKMDIKATRTPSIRKQMEDAAKEAWERFERELSNVRREARNYKFLTIVDGQCILSPENEEKLADTARIYLSDEKEIQAYKLHVEIIEKLNQLFRGQTPYRWAALFPEAAGKIARNEETNYSKLI